MSGASALELGRIARAVDALRAQYAAALPAVLDEADDWLSTGSQLAAAANMRALGATVEEWATRRRRWAERGERDDGTPYSVARFLDEGAAHAAAIRTHAGVAYDADVWASLTYAAGETASDVADAADPLRWPWWMTAAAALGALWIARPYVAVLGKAKG